MKKELFIIICCLLLFIGCTNRSNNTKENDVKMSDIKVTINDVLYTLKLEDNNTAKEFIRLLPQEYTMNELNGNEKYVYIDYSLTTTPYHTKHIEKGDVMLFGDNCLVIFYQSFETSYSYSKIGHIDHLDDLGNSSIIVKFEL